MKKFNLILMLVAMMSVAMVSCTEDTTEPTPGAQPELEITSEATMEFTAKGGNGEITYTLANVKEGVVPTVECEADWITDIVVEESIAFVVAPNSGDAREATITVSCEASSFDVTVKQGSILAFEIVVDEVTYSSVKFTVTPTDLEADYFIVLYDAKTIKEFTHDRFIITELYRQLEAAARAEGKTLAEYMPAYLDKGVVSDSYSSLAPETDYYLLAFGVDVENGFIANTDLTKHKFQTAAVDMIDVTFDVKTDVYYNTAEYTVTPSDLEVIWYFYTFEKAGYLYYTDPEGEEKMDNKEFISLCLSNQISQYRGAGYTDNQILNTLFHRGEMKLEVEALKTFTEYITIVAAFDVTPAGSITLISEPEITEYTTGDVMPSNLTFNITVTDIEATRAAIKVKPSNDKDSYVWMVQPYDGVSTPEQVMNKIVEDNKVYMDNGYWSFAKGTQDYTGGPGSPYKYKLDAPDTEYCVIAFGYSYGITSEPVMVTFRTLPAPDAATTEFTMRASNITPYSCDVSVTSSHSSTYYVVGICSPEEYDEAAIIKEHNDAFDKTLAMYEEQNVPITIPQLVSQYWNGNFTTVANGMSPETEVMGYILALDINTGHVAKAHAFNPLAKTTALGSVKPKVELVGYYSGEEAYKNTVFRDKDGKPIDTSAYAITVIKYSNFDGARSLFSTLPEDDCSNDIGYPDTDVWKACTGIWKATSLASPYSFYTTTWDTEYTALAYAVDNSGLIGGIGRLYVQPTVEDKSNIQELIELVNKIDALEQSSVAMPASLVVNEEPLAKPTAAAMPAVQQEMVSMPVAEAPAVLDPNKVMLLDVFLPFYLHR